MMMIPLLLFGLLATLLIAKIAVGKTGKRGRKQTSVKHNTFNRRNQKASKILSRYKKYRRLPILKNELDKIDKTLASLCLYNDIDRKLETVAVLERKIICTIVLSAVFAFLFKSVIFSALGILFAINYTDALMSTRRIDATNKMLVETDALVSQIAQNFNSLRNIPLSIENVEGTKVTSTYRELLLSVFNSKDNDAAMDEVYKYELLRPLLTYIVMAFQLNKRGDYKTKDGGSGFIDATQQIQREMKAKIIELSRIKLLICGREMGLLIMCILMFLVGKLGVPMIFSATVLVNKTIFVILADFAALLAIHLGFRKILEMENIGSLITSDKPDIVTKLCKSKNKFVKGAINLFIPYKEKHLKKMALQLRASQSRCNTREMYCKKALYGLVAIILTAILLVAGSEITRSMVNKNTDIITITPEVIAPKAKEEMRQQLLLMDKAYHALKVKPKSKDEFAKFVETQTYVNCLNDDSIPKHFYRLKLEEILLFLTKPTWVWSIIILALAVIGFKLPDRELKNRYKKLVDEEPIETLALQTLITVLSPTTITVVELIEEMKNNSSTYRIPLIACYNNYIGSPEDALTILSHNVNDSAMKVVINSLAVASKNTSLGDAFSGLRADSGLILKQKESQAEHKTKADEIKAKKIEGRVQNIVMSVTILLPLLILMIMEVANMADQFSQMSS